MITYRIPTLKIDIGSHPTANSVFPIREGELDKYNVFLNVSDDVPYMMTAETHWFPINEFGYWTYQPFYWLVRLMDKAVKENNNIYLHCHAGMHRSPMMGYLYLRSLGNSPDEAFSKFHDTMVLVGDANKNWLEETFQNDVEYGRIPADVVEFMKDVRKYEKDSLMHIMKKRGGLDLPQKAIEKNGIKKPVGKTQIDEAQKGIFHRED